MQRLDRNYILIGLCWVIFGMIYGAWLGASHHNNFANSHAHINLLGFLYNATRSQRETEGKSATTSRKHEAPG